MLSGLLPRKARQEDKKDGRLAFKPGHKTIKKLSLVWIYRIKQVLNVSASIDDIILIFGTFNNICKTISVQ